MCGIFGFSSEETFSVKRKEVKNLCKFSESRGKDSSGVLIGSKSIFSIKKSNRSICKLYDSFKDEKVNLFLGHARLKTNGDADNQPVIKNKVIVFHNGIILNHEKIWNKLKSNPSTQIDTEIIAELAVRFLEKSSDYKLLSKEILNTCTGSISCCIHIPERGKIILFSNNGSLFYGEKDNAKVFASEKSFLSKIKCSNIEQVFDPRIIDCLKLDFSPTVLECRDRKLKFLPSFNLIEKEESLLIHRKHNLKRCTKCILPETMPFIDFDSQGVCNYCNNYTPIKKVKPKEELLNLVNKYKKNDNRCIVPMSGGRDSIVCLDIAVNELNLKPVTYTYDWGMVTDLARRNISSVCQILGVENIIVAADIETKRRNIRNNLVAWLKSPHLGMISLLTAGDKHFFKYINNVKKDTGIKLNLWGINPLETTHFKSGFLGIKPNFLENKVYSSGLLNQINYQRLRLQQMIANPSYFNSSVFDTLSGEYYRTLSVKKDYFHIFDYWEWQEDKVHKVLDKYSFEYSSDTTTSWRIGDGTAAFYNYIYYNAVGFTENDTFRSNQIREGQLTREEALKLVEAENQPRYESIKWYLDVLGLDFSTVIKTINNSLTNFKKYL